MDLISKRRLLRDAFPSLNQFELVETIAAHSRYIKLPPGAVILDVGQPIRAIPLVLRGTVKVFREDDEAREAFLYYIRPGESCAITLAASLHPGTSRIKAVTLEETELMALAVTAVPEVNRKFPAWYHFVFDTFRNRFDELLNAFEAVIFLQLDSRILQYLQARAKTLGTTDLSISHSEIARDLATSREVISRVLKRMEKEKLVLLGRGHIRLLKNRP